MALWLAPQGEKGFKCRKYLCMLYLIGLNPCGAKFRARILLMRTDGVMVNSEEWFVPWKISHLPLHSSVD